MANKNQNPTILMLPWLAHGHISPYLELAKKLTKRNFNIYLCSTPINLKPFRSNLSNNPLANSSIEFIDIHLPSTPHLPPHYHTTKDLPPHLMSALKAAFDSASDAFASIIAAIKPSLIIYDFLMPWAPSIALQQNIKAVIFFTCGVATCSFLIHESRNQETEYPVSTLFFPENERKQITQFMYDSSNGLTNEERVLQSLERSSSIVLIKTSKEIESKYIEYFSIQTGKEVVPVGPLVQEFEDKEDDDKVFIEWLNKKKNSSVVFVSFGSEYFLSKEEIEEIAYGLELSGVDFIWVLRFHGGEKTKVHEVLPQGFLRRVGDRGMVVEGWAPQGKILKHESIGGFVSHCGWSSTLEGVRFGVPIVAMPMHLDQPLNAKVVVGAGVGVEVKRENGRFKSEEVARVIRQVVVEDEGKEVRERVKEVRERMSKEGDEEVDVVVEKLVQLIEDA